MAITRNNEKINTTSRALKRERDRARKKQASRHTSEHHLANLRLYAFNYNAKQSRRWLRARVLSEDRGFVTKDTASQLVKHFQKTEFQLQNPKITDAVLTPDAKLVLSQLELERNAARQEQGHPERVQDWFAMPTVAAKKKGKMKMTGKTQGTTAGQSDDIEGLGDDVEGLRLGEEDEMEEEGEGGVLSKEESEELRSPTMMYPTGSVVGEGEKMRGSESVLCLRSRSLPDV